MIQRFGCAHSRCAHKVRHALDAYGPKLDHCKTADFMRGLVVIREDRVRTGKRSTLTKRHIARGTERDKMRRMGTATNTGHWDGLLALLSAH
jgi:hypothetical protein